MRKVLLATTALATVAGFTAVATADVTVGGNVEWRYISYSDDETSAGGNTNRASDNRFDQLVNMTISLSQTTDTGLTFAASQTGMMVQPQGPSHRFPVTSVQLVYLKVQQASVLLLLTPSLLPVMPAVTVISPATCTMVP